MPTFFKRGVAYPIGDVASAFPESFSGTRFTFVRADRGAAIYVGKPGKHSNASDVFASITATQYIAAGRPVHFRGEDAIQYGWVTLPEGDK